MENLLYQSLNGKNIKYSVGDKPFTAICDYMDKCSYTCKANKNITNVVAIPLRLDLCEQYEYKNSNKSFVSSHPNPGCKTLKRTTLRVICLRNYVV